MNLTAGRILLSLKGRCNIIHCTNREKMRTEICSTVSIQARNRTKIARPNLFDIDSRHEDHRQHREEEPTGIYGYALLGIPICTFLLGTWQVQRRKWKLGLIEDLNRRITEDPIDLPENLEELKTKEYYRVRVKGTFLHDKEFTIGPRPLIVDGKVEGETTDTTLRSSVNQRGYCVVTPFKLHDRDLTILVNRGWVPARYKNPSRREEGQTQGVTEIVGVVRLHETRPPFVPANSPKNGSWFYRDVNAMAEMAGTAPVYIEMVPTKDTAGIPIGGQTKVTLRNEHMSYIITWYSLSAITGYMWHRMFIRKLPLR